MVVVTACASGNKGGTGKTVTASLLAYHLAVREGQRVLVVDVGERGSSTLLLLERDPGPPYLSDYFYGRTGWSDIIVESPFSGNLLVAPSSGEIGPADAATLEYMFDRVSGYVDYVILDLPSYPGTLYDTLVELAQIVVAVFNPDVLSYTAVSRWLHEKGLLGKRLVLPLLNKYVFVLREWREKAEDDYGTVFILPFDSALMFTATRNIEEAFRAVSSRTRKEVEVLAYRVKRPLLKVTA